MQKSQENIIVKQQSVLAITAGMYAFQIWIDYIELKLKDRNKFASNKTRKMCMFQKEEDKMDNLRWYIKKIHDTRY